MTHLLTMCGDCITRSEAISESIGMKYSTLCKKCQEAWKTEHEAYKPVNSKSYTDYSKKEGRG